MCLKLRLDLDICTLRSSKLILGWDIGKYMLFCNLMAFYDCDILPFHSDLDHEIFSNLCGLAVSVVDITVEDVGSIPGWVRGLGGVAVRLLTSNLCGHRFESRAGRFILESW